MKNKILWVIQVLLALLFIFAGVTKLFPSDAALVALFPIPALLTRFIGVCEVLGGFGLVLPGIFKIKQWLTPLAASGLIIIMIGAVVVTIMSMGIASAIPPFVIGLLLAFVAKNRK